MASSNAKKDFVSVHTTEHFSSRFATVSLFSLPTDVCSRIFVVFSSPKRLLTPDGQYVVHI